MHPSQVSKLLNLSPETTVAKGERSLPNLLGLSGMRGRNGWFLSFGAHVKSKDVRPHLDWLIAELERAGEGLQVLRSKPGVHMEVFCVFWTNHGGGTVPLWPQQMRALADMNPECSVAFADYGSPDA